MQRRHFIQASLLASAVPAAWAQANGAFPDKPVKFILSQPPGSGPDNVARLLGERLGKALGQPIVIENKPGGQNIIGAQTAARSPADGYSLYFATTAALVTNKYLFKTMPYDPEKDFVPVAFIAKSPFAVVVKAESPITSMQDLVARSKAEPGKVSLANEGPRTFGGIIARVINARTRMQANLVGYASVGVAVQNLIGGHADVAVADVASTAALVRQGRLRYLAVTAAKRVAGWEQVPALSELLPGFEMVGWFAVVAPTGTPAAAIQRMNKEINALLGDADVMQRMATIGPMAEALGAPEQTGAFLGAEHQRWSAAAQEIGLLPE
ncbi:tripartite tricarboxylate transporter substrate binding protein [Rhodoferax sp. BAB1]|uniref:Bug family tripartite tricarboxylate transporter substrate binding protein n=1 Tax=Rhodoferax sp. BAB1 TaxID=2741720 RepID=UPI001576133B|nr:tripartite tricarboxylate transporter substrate binding protein [Rhodoferax sp. BAB1]QKO21139.1 tripartite tricarboxylate transporter substrate binding protein [Rhodoferax sp. BAB1]